MCWLPAESVPQDGFTLVPTTQRTQVSFPPCPDLRFCRPPSRVGRNSSPLEVQLLSLGKPSCASPPTPPPAISTPPGCWRRISKPSGPGRWRCCARNTGRRCRPWWLISAVLKPGSRPGWLPWKLSKWGFGPRLGGTCRCTILLGGPTHPSVPGTLLVLKLEVLSSRSSSVPGKLGRLVTHPFRKDNIPISCRALWGMSTV